ncbi:MAG: AIR synthase-related protein, partial [Candidatus Acidiferrales bacterium]
ACTVLETPITGGNVSLYNETLGKPIYPTPVLGVLGIIEDAENALGCAFRAEGDAIVLLDGAKNSQPAAAAVETAREFSSSEYARTIHGIVSGAPPAIDLAAEKRLIDCLVALAAARAIVSAHDVSDGGIGVTLAESAFASEGLSGDIQIAASPPEAHAETALFGERGARAVVSLPASKLAAAASIAAQYEVRWERIGTVVRDDFRIEFKGLPVIRAEASSLRKVWAQSLGKLIESA